MKWPNTLTIVRHAESAYNELKAKKEADPLYQDFKKEFNRRGKNSTRVEELARELMRIGSFALGTGDHDTEITTLGAGQAEITGMRLPELIPKPDVILVSPYGRTWKTLGHMTIGWPELADVKQVEEVRLREQEHGLSLLYSDWRIFETLHPEQAALRKIQGSYWYRFPQGENVPDVQERLRSLTNTLTRDYYEQNVLMIAHHLTILGLRANLERFGADEFMRLDEQEKPINCGATIYRGDPDLGQNGKLILDIYNKKLY